MKPTVREALDRLLIVAQSRTGQGRKVANMLLSWWNADTCGAFDLRDLWGLDADIKTDAVWVLVYAATACRYPDTLGFEPQFERLVRCWRPELIREHEASVERGRGVRL